QVTEDAAAHQFFAFFPQGGGCRLVHMDYRTFGIGQCHEIRARVQERKGSCLGLLEEFSMIELMGDLPGNADDLNHAAVPYEGAAAYLGESAGSVPDDQLVDGRQDRLAGEEVQ